MVSEWIDDLKRTPKPVLVGGAALVGGLLYLIWRGGSGQPSSAPAASNAPEIGASSPSPYASLDVAGQTYPVLPPGVSPLYGPGGSLVGFQQPAAPSQPAPAAPPPATSSSLPAGVWRGPTGVLHYTVTGPTTVAAVAHMFGLQVGAINAIPDNLKHYPRQMNQPYSSLLPEGAILTLPGSLAQGG
ncbi:MAG: hypothetical protein IMW90_15115 [Thermogemmatispora sp.]|uniref:hypothetical protein n=1 Tax=Thermogemmatispora sp. TaxID=1968838 RepID=UPI0019DBAA1A|nr:hypothetical protein [Thermogemmatispora sp.]MBE3567048.1 hypothetical protein [Thermogemmatispora sp.]